MSLQPYMPDAARIGMPHPLPLYLREDFQPFLDKDRPHEPLPQPRALKSGTLRYRYTDTGEEVVVPDAWYNQTREMRLAYWTAEVQQAHERMTSAQRQQAMLQEPRHARLQGARLPEALKDAALLESRWAARKAALVEIQEAVQRGERLV